MTVGELVETASFCTDIEVVVRENGGGKWIHGYRIGKNAEMWKSEYTIELQEVLGEKIAVRKNGDKYNRMTLGEIRDVYNSINLKIKIMKRNVSNLPDNVSNLNVYSFQPRHIPSFHGEMLTHNEFALDINVYPEGWEPDKVETKTADSKTNTQYEGQTDIFDFLEE